MKYVKVQVPDDFDGSDITGRVTPNSCTTSTLEQYEPEYREVLDHGYVGLVDFMGDDMSIVDAARVSYGKGTKKSSSDEGLVRYLMRHRHTTPFEMVSFKWHIKAPIFVFRQWHRHRTASINEYSGRYSVIDDDMYLASQEHMKPQSTDNKQGRSSDMLADEDYAAICSVINHIFEESYQAYRHLLGPNEIGDVPNPPDAILKRIQWCQDAALSAVRAAKKRAIESEKDDPYPTEESVEALIRLYYEQNGVAVLDEDFPGLAKELARKVLPVATYSQMYWKTNLHNLFHFLSLRCDPHAQYEIRVYADQMLEMIEPFVPWAVKAFKDYNLHGMHLSRVEVDILRALTDHYAKSGDLNEWVGARMKINGCSKREIREFLSKIAS